MALHKANKTGPYREGVPLPSESDPNPNQNEPVPGPSGMQRRVIPRWAWRHVDPPEFVTLTVAPDGPVLNPMNGRPMPYKFNGHWYLYTSDMEKPERLPDSVSNIGQTWFQHVSSCKHSCLPDQ